MNGYDSNSFLQRFLSFLGYIHVHVQVKICRNSKFALLQSNGLRDCYFTIYVDRYDVVSGLYIVLTDFTFVLFGSRVLEW